MSNFNVSFFQAINNQELCANFLSEHQRVLGHHGITNITTNNNKWFSDPSVYVIVVHNTETGELVGGVRIHIKNGSNPLPLEDAVGSQDDAVYSLVQNRAEAGVTAELCGLWCAKSVSGMGVSKTLMRAGIACCYQLNMSSLLTLSSSYTSYLVCPTGFVANTSFYNEGEFVYPNKNSIAMVSELLDLENLTMTEEEEREEILALKKNPSLTKEAVTSKGIVSTTYQLALVTEKESVKVAR